MTTTSRLANETAAANALREALKSLTDDPEAIRDTIEGETSLHDAIAAVMADVFEDELLVKGIIGMMVSLSDRKERLERRIAARRSAIERAMQIGELQSLTLPDCTISLRRVPAGLEITDEARIPEKFWKLAQPVLDRKALKDALKDGEMVEGAMLGNGSVTLSVRRS